MHSLLAAATNDLASGQPVEKLAVVLNFDSVLWAIAFTFVWDVVDLWIRYRRFHFMKAQPFVLYLLFHIGLSVLATIVLAQTMTTPWLVGLFAAATNEMILSNANVTFGQAPILPLLEKFRELRAAMQQEIDALRKAEGTDFLNKLAALPLGTLRTQVVNLLIQAGKTPQQVNEQFAELEKACAGNEQLLAVKLANDFVQLDPVHAKNTLEGAQSANE
jgi:hypothetical protein